LTIQGTPGIQSSTKSEGLSSSGSIEVVVLRCIGTDHDDLNTVTSTSAATSRPPQKSILKRPKEDPKNLKVHFDPELGSVTPSSGCPFGLDGAADWDDAPYEHHTRRGAQRLPENRNRASDRPQQTPARRNDQARAASPRAAHRPGARRVLFNHAPQTDTYPTPTRPKRNSVDPGTRQGYVTETYIRSTVPFEYSKRTYVPAKAYDDGTSSDSSGTSAGTSPSRRPICRNPQAQRLGPPVPCPIYYSYDTQPYPIYSNVPQAPYPAQDPVNPDEATKLNTTAVENPLGIIWPPAQDDTKVPDKQKVGDTVQKENAWPRTEWDFVQQKTAWSDDASTSTIHWPNNFGTLGATSARDDQPSFTKKPESTSKHKSNHKAHRSTKLESKSGKENEDPFVSESNALDKLRDMVTESNSSVAVQSNTTDMKTDAQETASKEEVRDSFPSNSTIGTISTYTNSSLGIDSGTSQTRMRPPSSRESGSQCRAGLPENAVVYPNTEDVRYLDSFQRPYALFRFKYRTKEVIKRILETGVESEGGRTQG